MRDTKYDRWYRRRLHNYFEEHYAEYEDYIEYYNDPAVNQWLFYVPQLGVNVELTCDKEGTVTEQRYKLPMDVERAYNIIDCNSEGLDAIYEDYIISLVGETGFGLLRRAKLLQTCGSIHGRNLYVLCDKK